MKVQGYIEQTTDDRRQGGIPVYSLERQDGSGALVGSVKQELILKTNIVPELGNSTLQ